MKKYAFVLACVMLTFCISCRNIGKPVDRQKSGSYFIDSKGKISYCQNGNWFSLGILPMQADAQSFEVLAEDIARDKDAVYFRSTEQKLADRNSFYVENQIPKDRFHAYYIDQALGFNIIKGADPRTYEPVKGHMNWTRDKDHYFYAYDRVPADRKTFAFVNGFFMKDKDSVYTVTDTGKFKSILPNPGPVEAVNPYYMRIGNTLYYPSFRADSEVVARSFDAIDTIRVLDQHIICVNNKTLLVQGKNFRDANVDAATFQLLTVDDKDDLYAGNFYAKDKSHVYYDQEIIPGADTKTFILIGRDFGKDAKNVYYRKQKLKGVDAASFKKKGNYYQDRSGNKFSVLTGNKV
ncbi:DKNYY domain-containing protein [Chryseobacterium gregarium]|uniref:DKNYY domain-containing protein n=1 Tax=Chryseobacterium gregarium TaxID=456299 RepID=UPI000421B188|nr:DKNYY domain-containing protein [Chryseobacterium gregarium]